MDTAIENLKYPIGRFPWPNDASTDEIANALEIIRVAPEKFQKTIEPLSPVQLDTTYRPEGWTVRQVVHHVADSHMNGYFRFKLALTEDSPTIKPYDQTRWAMLRDSLSLEPAVSLALITNIHIRWVLIMENMSPSDWDRIFIHPEHNRRMSLKQTALMYSWHSQHHLAHITSLAERMGW